MNGSVAHRESTREQQAIPGLLKLSRYIGRNMPALRGKNLILRSGLLRLTRELPIDTTITTLDGLKFVHCNLNQFIYRELYVYGLWEPDVVWMYDRLLSPADTVLDVGACFGYHALRAAVLVGKRGRVYAVEPQPEAFAALHQNLAENQLENVEPDCLALAAEDGNMKLHRFSDLDLGHTSMSTLNRSNFETLQCRTQRLDEYIKFKKLQGVTLVKLDVEGAEMPVLRGASDLLSGPKPPIVILEINMETAKSCGYHPNDLLALLRQYRYNFYRPVWGKIARKIAHLEECQTGRHGENLLCAIEEVHSDQLRRVGANRVRCR